MSISALCGGRHASIAAKRVWLHALCAVIGFGVAASENSQSAAGTQWVQRNRGLALGIVYCGSNLGGSLVTRAVAEVSQATSWRHALLIVCGGGALLLLPFGWFAVRDRPGGPVGDADAGDEPAVAARADDFTVREALRTRSFWILFATLLAFWMFFLALLQHFVLFLTDTGMAREDAAGFLSIAVAMGIASKLGFGWIADRIGARASYCSTTAC